MSQFETDTTAPVAPAPDFSYTLGQDEFQVNNYTVGPQRQPSIIGLNDGGYFIAWESDGQDGDKNGIYGQMYDNTGAVSGNEFQINTFTTRNQSSPSVTSMSDGGFMVAWHSNHQAHQSYEIFGQRFNSAGYPWGAEFQINTETLYGQFNP